jgi:transcriptional regulator with XRE-family HTH domain
MEIFRMTFFERLKVEIKANKMTIKDVVDQAGLTKGTYNTYRRRGLLPRADEATIMAKALNTTVEYLVTGEEPLVVIPSDQVLFERARRYRRVLEDLDSLDPIATESWTAGIHGAASAAAAKTIRLNLKRA